MNKIAGVRPLLVQMVMEMMEDTDGAPDLKLVTLLQPRPAQFHSALDSRLLHRVYQQSFKILWSLEVPEKSYQIDLRKDIKYKQKWFFIEKKKNLKHIEGVFFGSSHHVIHLLQNPIAIECN